MNTHHCRACIHTHLQQLFNLDYIKESNNFEFVAKNLYIDYERTPYRAGQSCRVLAFGGGLGKFGYFYKLITR